MDKQRFYAWPFGPEKFFVPSVTTVLKVVAQPGLVRWQQEQAIRASLDDVTGWARTGLVDGETERVERLVETRSRAWLEEADRASEQARFIGSDVHALCEQLHRGRGVPVSPGQAEDQNLVRELYEAYCDWYEQSVETPLEAEAVVHGEHCINFEAGEWLQYGGMLDLHCALRPGAIIAAHTRKQTRLLEAGKTAIVDIKASADYYPEMGMQLAAYARSIEVRGRLAREGYRPVPDYLVTVRLDKRRRFAYVKTWDLAACWEMFCAALLLWWRLNPSAAANYALKQAEDMSSDVV